MLNLGAEWDHTAVPIYESAARGKCVPLLKTLLSSNCKNECAYCTFRAGRKVQRMTWETSKLADVTMHLWQRRKICGLFLSSSVSNDPDLVTEQQLETLRILRKRGYTGYVHLRLMPGVSRYYVKEAVELADRVGINLEAANKEDFDELCPNKGGFNEAILKRLRWLVNEVEYSKRDAACSKFGFGRSGIDTQMIVGALDDNDWQYVQATEWLYSTHSLKRVYYSSFEPIAQTPLEKRASSPKYREHRLYQCSFLMRDYGFKADALTPIIDDKGFLPNADPKLALAKNEADMFPLDLNTATYFELVRIPRVGPLTAKKIIQARNNRKIRVSADLNPVIGARLTRRISSYIELKDKKLTEFKGK
jgi:predicted DNA-binding helix-hairpin-helix protein